MKFMFSNIKWKMPWSIHFRQEFGEYGQVKHGDWCVRLVNKDNDEIRDIILETAPDLCFDNFYSLEGKQWINYLMVMPNEERYIRLENVSKTRWFEIEITKCECAFEGYKVKVVETYRGGKIRRENGICNVCLLDEKEYKKVMGVFDSYMDVFPFLLPLGESLSVDIEND